jgi:N-acetylglucosaminyl-diphospho-decaprenol L-rhamnosyltransferase
VFLNGDWPPTPVIIVSYRTADDVAGCLTSLDALPAEPDFSVHICENGGATAWNDLCTTLLRPGGPCMPAEDVSHPFRRYFDRIACLRLRRSGRMVLVGDAPENLGYAGGINAWLSPLTGLLDWRACWILNPDTLVAPDALIALTVQASNRELGIVGSRIMASPMDTRVQTRGLRWRLVFASTLAVGRNSPADVEPTPEAIEAMLDAPSGASCYLTRPCAEALVPLDERYFLFFEDLDWGVRARRAGFRVGHAHASVVIDVGGTSIGSSRSSGSVASPLAVYLEFRNRLLFVRTHYHRWLVWTALMGCLHALRFLPRGGFGPAVRGLLAGLKGETGRPDRLVTRHHVPGSRGSSQDTPSP